MKGAEAENPQGISEVNFQRVVRFGSFRGFVLVIVSRPQFSVGFRICFNF